jgi:hypothetical protein
VVRRLAPLFEIDLRSLALFRVGLAATILLDLASRARDLTAHYTDAGVLPRELLAIGLRPSVGGLIATYWPGGLFATVLAFAIYAAFALSLLVGFRTRWASVLCWVGQLAVLARDPLVLHRADTLVKMLLFWGMFLPLGARASVDRWLARRRSPETDPFPAQSVISPASAALLLQPCIMFWSAVLARSSTEWWHEGSALYYASQCDVIVRPLGAALRDLPARASVLLTRAVVLSEVGLPLLLWSPWATSTARILALTLLLLMSLAFGTAFHIGLFPLACVVAVVPFLPRRAWGAPDAPAGSLGLGRWATAAVGGLLLFSLAMNLEEQWKGFLRPRALRVMGTFVGLDQRWDIFAPSPPKEDEWFVVLGRLHDGSMVDLVSGGGEPTLDKPERFSDYWRDYRWRRYWYNLRNYPVLYQAYVNYAGREWDGRHAPAQQLDAVRIERLREPTPPFGAAGNLLAPLERETVWPPAAVR